MKMKHLNNSKKSKSIGIHDSTDRRAREKICEHSWLINVVTNPDTREQHIEEKDRRDIIAHLAEEIVTACYAKTCRGILENFARGGKGANAFSPIEIDIIRDTCMKYLIGNLSDNEMRLQWLVLVDTKDVIESMDDIPTIYGMREAVANKMVRRILLEAEKA